MYVWRERDDGAEGGKSPRRPRPAHGQPATGSSTFNVQRSTDPAGSPSAELPENPICVAISVPSGLGRFRLLCTPHPSLLGGSPCLCLGSEPPAATKSIDQSINRSFHTPIDRLPYYRTGTYHGRHARVQAPCGVSRSPGRPRFRPRVPPTSEPVDENDAGGVDDDAENLRRLSVPCRACTAPWEAGCSCWCGDAARFGFLQLCTVPGVDQEENLPRRGRTEVVRCPGGEGGTGGHDEDGGAHDGFSEFTTHLRGPGGGHVVHPPGSKHPEQCRHGDRLVLVDAARVRL